MATSASQPTLVDPGAAPAASAAAPRSDGPGARDAAIDNARWFLIVLVVLGHFLTTLRDNPVIHVVYTWIYLFHMPAFVFLAGLVIGGDRVAPRQGARLVSGLIAPLVVFTALYQGFTMLVGKRTPTDETLMDPYWLLWFLVALVMWRLLVPVLRSLRWPVATTVVVASALVVLADLPSALSIDRFIVLLPFFTAGLVLTPERLAVLRSAVGRLAAVVVLVASVPIAFWAAELPGGFITFSDGVGGADRSAIGDLSEFLVLYLVAAAMVAAVLALAPTRRGVIASWGARTMYVYLLHGFFVQAFRATDLSDSLASTWGLALLAVLSVGVAVLLSSDRVVGLTRRIVQPDISWLLRDEGPATQRPTGRGGRPRPRRALPLQPCRARRCRARPLRLPGLRP